MKVHKFFRARYTEAWWQLTPEVQNAHNARVMAALQQAGGRTVVMATPYWSEEQ